MLITTFEFIAQHVSDVTPAQIGKCHKAEGPNSADIFYQVENGGGARDAAGAIIEYAVKHNPKQGYTCTCKSGQEGFKNVKRHPSRVCWHVRAAVACELELQEYHREMAAKEAEAEEARQIDEDEEARHQLDTEHLTSHAGGTRAALELDEHGEELTDAAYRSLILKPTEESRRPFPKAWLGL